jgi:putative acetyltransferase
MAVTVAIEPPRQDDLLDLLRQSDEFNLSLYPPESCYLLNVDDLEQPGVSVLVARDAGVAIGIVALVDRGDGSGEIKRMLVTESARGLGVARGILAALETHASGLGITTIQLETGPLQHAAIALYERCGYARIPNFGQYVGDQWSVCMEKQLR